MITPCDFKSFTECPGCGCEIKTYAKPHLGPYIWYWCGVCLCNKKLYRYKLTGYEMRELIMKDKVYSIKELSEKIGVSDARIRYHLRTGRLPYFEIARKMKFRERDVEYIVKFLSIFRKNAGRKAIQDELTDKDVSRQRKWQLRHPRKYKMIEKNKRLKMGMVPREKKR